MDDTVVHKRKPSEAEMEKLMEQRSHILNELKGGDGEHSNSSPTALRDRSHSANSNSRTMPTTPTRHPQSHKLSDVFDLDWQKSPKRLLQRQNSSSNDVEMMDATEEGREPDSLEARLQQIDADKMDDPHAQPSTSHA